MVSECAPVQRERWSFRCATGSHSGASDLKQVEYCVVALLHGVECVLVLKKSRGLVCERRSPTCCVPITSQSLRLVSLEEHSLWWSSARYEARHC
jgi:hypothetical protein